MKYYSSIFLTLLAVASMVVGCKESPYITGPGNNDNNADSLVVVIVDTSGISISIDSALTICQNLTPGTTTAERYKLTGEIIADSKNTDPNTVPSQYTNINFKIKDATGKSITCQYTNNLNNRPFLRSDRVPRVGTRLTVVGPLSLYESKNGNQTPQMLNGFVACYDSLVVPPPFPGCPAPAEGQISVTQAIQLAGQLGKDESSTDTYDIVGVVTEVTELSTQFGNATFNISDNGKNSFICFRIKSINGDRFTADNQVLFGDTVVVRSQLLNYKGTTPETAKNGVLVSSSNPNLK